MCRVSAGQSISQASLDCAVTLFVFILSNFFHFPVCNLNIFFVLVCVCVCEFIFVMLHKLYCAASTSSCYCCSLARRIHCKLLFFTHICAHFYFHFIFGTCQWIVCHATSCARAGRGSQPTLLLPPHTQLVSVCATFVASCESSARRLSFTRLTRSHHSPPTPFAVPLLTLETGVAWGMRHVAGPTFIMAA